MSSFPERKYEVLVRCMTYNQSIYILDALNGFAMQRTDFPFVCVVMDDASTDGEPEIIKGFLERECAMESAEYSEIEDANIVIVPHKTNVNCTFAVYFLKRNLYETNKKEPMLAPWREKCRYEALCEGDDYWIDPGKLQKQYNVLENMPDVSLCYHIGMMLHPDGSINEPIYKDIPQIASEADIVRCNFILTHSVLYRIDLETNKKLESLGSMSFGDYPLWIFYSQIGNLYRIDEVMGVYRMNVGVWGKSNLFEQGLKSAVGYGKIFPLIQNNINKQVFDKQINTFLNQTRQEYYKILFSREYKLGCILLKPFRKIVQLLRN